MLLLTLIEHDAGDHWAELRQARRLVALAPRDWFGRLCLRRAARCNSLEPLAQSATVQRTAGER